MIQAATSNLVVVLLLLALGMWVMSIIRRLFAAVAALDLVTHVAMDKRCGDRIFSASLSRLERDSLRTIIEERHSNLRSGATCIVKSICLPAAIDASKTCVLSPSKEVVDAFSRRRQRAATAAPADRGSANGLSTVGGSRHFRLLSPSSSDSRSLRPVSPPPIEPAAADERQPAAVLHVCFAHLRGEAASRGALHFLSSVATTSAAPASPMTPGVATWTSSAIQIQRNFSQSSITSNHDDAHDMQTVVPAGQTSRFDGPPVVVGAVASLGASAEIAVTPTLAVSVLRTSAEQLAEELVHTASQAKSKDRSLWLTGHRPQLGNPPPRSADTMAPEDAAGAVCCASSEMRRRCRCYHHGLQLIGSSGATVTRRGADEVAVAPAQSASRSASRRNREDAVSWHEDCAGAVPSRCAAHTTVSSLMFLDSEWRCMTQHDAAVRVTDSVSAVQVPICEEQQLFLVVEDIVARCDAAPALLESTLLTEAQSTKEAQSPPRQKAPSCTLIYRLTFEAIEGPRGAGCVARQRVSPEIPESGVVESIALSSQPRHQDVQVPSLLPHPADVLQRCSDIAQDEREVLSRHSDVAAAASAALSEEKSSSSSVSAMFSPMSEPEERPAAEMPQFPRRGDESRHTPLPEVVSGDFSSSGRAAAGGSNSPSTTARVGSAGFSLAFARFGHRVYQLQPVFVINDEEDDVQEPHHSLVLGASMTTTVSQRGGGGDVAAGGGYGVCTVCYSNPNHVVLLPCGHCGFCMVCVRRLQHCPVCRVAIQFTACIMHDVPTSAVTLV